MKITKYLRLTKKKVAIIAVLLVLFFISLPFFNKPRVAAIQFAQVKQEDIKTTISSSGTLTGQNSAVLKFSKGGKLAYINVKPGDKVFAGQIVAGLDAAELNIDLQQAQNTLRDKQAALDKILDDIHLFQYGNGGFGNVGSSSETMTQRQLRTAAEVAKDNAADSVKNAQRAFTDVTITSPINGLVTQAVSVPGSTVGASDIIAQVVDNSQLIFETDVDETDIANVSVGQKAVVSLDAYPNKTFSGEVSEIQPQIKTTSSGANVVPVKIKLEGELTFINGLSGQAEIILNQQAGALIIPQEALRDDNTVVLSVNGELRPQQVVLGIKSDTMVEIKSGLKANDRVLLNPPAPGTALRQASTNPLNRIMRMFGGGPRGPQVRFR